MITRLLLACGYLIVAAFIAMVIAVGLQNDPGYAALSIAGWTIQTSFTLAVVFLTALFLVLFWLFSALGKLTRSRSAWQRRDHLRSHQLLARGLEYHLEGQWKAAEKTFIRGIKTPKMAPLHATMAALSANKQSVGWRSQSYLRGLQDQKVTHDSLLPTLTQARLHLQSNEIQQAIALLHPLLAKHRTHPMGLKLLTKSYMQANEWEKAALLLPNLEKSHIMQQERLRRWQVRIYQHAVIRVGQRGSLDALHRLWLKIPLAVRHQPNLLLAYAGQLRDNGSSSEAESLLRESLKRQWSAELIIGYSEIGRGNPAAQLANAEKWLAEHGQDAYLLLTCGRLAYRANQEHKALDYLQRSLKHHPMADTCELLAEIYLQQDNQAAALKCYQHGMSLLTGRTPDQSGETLPVQKFAAQQNALDDQNQPEAISNGN